MVKNKLQQRKRRALRGRSKIKLLHVPRLCVHRSNTHMYAQLIAPDGAVLASASTLDKTVKPEIKTSSNVDAAKLVGKILAQRATQVGIKKIAFDRSGYKFHGRVKALADAARESGLEF